MHNPNIERAVLELLPEIGRAERARSEIFTQSYAGTHIAALGPARIRDLLLPYLGDPRRKLGPLPGPEIIGPASYSNSQAYIARGSLSSEFAKALTQVGLLGERVVYAKYIRGTWFVLPCPREDVHYVFSMDVNKVNARIVHGKSSGVLYLPCGLENHGNYIQNKYGNRVHMYRCRAGTNCDDFGHMYDRHVVHYLSEYTADFLRVNIA